MSRRAKILTAIGCLLAAVLSGIALTEVFEPRSQTRRMWDEHHVEDPRLDYAWLPQ